MHKILSLWKQQDGMGVYETTSEQDAIKCIELAINAMPNRELAVVVPSSLYHTYRRYFTNKCISATMLYDANVSTKKYFATFIVGVDNLGDDLKERVKNLNSKYRLYITKDYDKVPTFVKDKCLLLKDEIKHHIEYNYIVPMSDDVSLQYSKIESTMKDIMGVFRSYDNISACIQGTGITSAYDYRVRFADENGWSKDLNLDIPMFAQIDNVYNPDKLFEQATLYNQLVREREKVLNTCDDKLSYAVSTILVNPNKQILVLVKGDSTCEDLVSKLNKLSIVPDGQKAEAIHANTQGRYLRDDNGDIIKYKGGSKKGLFKVFGTKVVNDSIISRFNEGKIKTIVTTGTLNKTSNIKGIDLIICISPKGANYFKIKSRLARLEFKNNVNVINITFDVPKDIGVFKQVQQSLNLTSKDIINLDDAIF